MSLQAWLAGRLLSHQARPVDHDLLDH